MSNRIFQNVVTQMKDSINRTIGVVDETATIIACSDLSRIGETNEFLVLDIADSDGYFVRDGYYYKTFGSHSKPEYAVFIEGTDDMSVKFASLLTITFLNLKQFYDDK